MAKIDLNVEAVAVAMVREQISQIDGRLAQPVVDALYNSGYNPLKDEDNLVSSALELAQAMLDGFSMIISDSDETSDDYESLDSLIEEFESDELADEFIDSSREFSEEESYTDDSEPSPEDIEKFREDLLKLPSIQLLANELAVDHLKNGLINSEALKDRLSALGWRHSSGRDVYFETILDETIRTLELLGEKLENVSTGEEHFYDSPHRGKQVARQLKQAHLFSGVSPIAGSPLIAKADKRK